MSRVSLTTLTAHYMRSRGWIGDVTQRQQGPISRDFLGFADSVWIRSEASPGVRLRLNALVGMVRAVAVQHTSVAHLADRVTKVQREPRAKDWLKEGGEIWVIGWPTREAYSRPKVVEVTLA